MIGGSGNLGKETIKRYKKGGYWRGWKVFNIDTVANKDATENFIVDPTEPITPEIIEKLHERLKIFDGEGGEFEVMINTAGYWYPPNNKKYLDTIGNPEYHPLSISSPDCFDHYEQI
jgi:hypothetical protein